MHLLIDGDILVYRVGFTTEKDDWAIARIRLQDMLQNLLHETSALTYQIYLSDATENTFRKKINPFYKANRSGKKPKHYENLKLFLVEHENALITAEQEADDALGISQTFFENQFKWGYDNLIGKGQLTIGAKKDKVFPTAIASIDKDLKQVPGLHYNFVKKEWTEVSKRAAERFFTYQLLVGDVSDNIFGIKGIGKVKAEKLLDIYGGYNNEYQFRSILDLYRREVMEDKDRPLDSITEKEDAIAINRLWVNGVCLKIRTIKDEIWTFPKPFQKLQPKMDDLSFYLPTSEKEFTRS